MAERSSRDNAELLLEAIDGQMAAIWQLLETANARSKLRRAIYVSPKGLDSAEDLYVDAVISVSERLPKERETVNEIRQHVEGGDVGGAISILLGFAFKRFRNIVRTYNRRVQRESSRFWPIGEIDLLADVHRGGPLSQPEYDAFLGQLRDAIQDLPDRQRRVVLGLCRGQSYSDLAKELHRSEADLRCIRMRAVRRLRQSLDHGERHGS